MRREAARVGAQVGDNRTGPGQEPKWTGRGGQTGLGGVFVQNRAQGSGLGIGRGWGEREGRGAVPGMETQRKNKLREMLKRV